MENNYPQKTSLEIILKQAFGYWNKTLVYQMFFSLITFSVMFLVTYYFSTKYGVLEQYTAASAKAKEGFEVYAKEIQKITTTPEYLKLSWISLLTMVFLYPLNLGFFKIYRKIDLKEKVEIEDLFAGYSGINFFIYTSFYLFWLMIFTYTLPTIILAIVWIMITLFCAPLMFFMDKRIIESIKLSIKALRLFGLEITVCIFVAFLFKYLGVLTLVGGLFTFPFFNAMIYALYKNIFVEKG